MKLDFLDGNEMVCYGALYAGCKFFAGYPITPASSILHLMFRELPKVNGIAIQGEDEIASLGFCLGASCAGLKCMTATSGPGISLYSEQIGLSIMAEIPVVIVDVQRQGPATGSATKFANGDIQFIRWGTSGGIPIIALAPTDAYECFTFTAVAFNIAELLRCPVFVLTDAEIGGTKQRIDWDLVEKPPVIERKKAYDTTQFIPYKITNPEDIPLFLEFGKQQIVRYCTSSHDEFGNITGDVDKIRKLVEHLKAKIEKHRKEVELTKFLPMEGADTLIISYGITSRACLEAVNIAKGFNKKVSLLIIYTIWPVPEETILKCLTGINKVIVPENNLGQYILEIKRIAKEQEVIGIQKMDTTLISPSEILEYLK